MNEIKIRLSEIDLPLLKSQTVFKVNSFEEIVNIRSIISSSTGKEWDYLRSHSTFPLYISYYRGYTSWSQNKDSYISSNTTAYTFYEIINKEKEMITVDKEFIKEAYDAACDTWKKKLWNKFPDVFGPSLEEQIKEYIRINCIIYDANRIEIRDKYYIFISTPLANNEWTEEIFEWVKNFINFCSKLNTNGFKPFVDWAKTYESKHLVISLKNLPF